jgi:hypothetical protein
VREHHVGREAFATQDVGGAGGRVAAADGRAQAIGRALRRRLIPQQPDSRDQRALPAQVHLVADGGHLVAARGEVER